MAINPSNTPPNDLQLKILNNPPYNEWGITRLKKYAKDNPGEFTFRKIFLINFDKVDTAAVVSGSGASGAFCAAVVATAVSATEAGAAAFAAAAATEAGMAGITAAGGVATAGTIAAWPIVVTAAACAVVAETAIVSVNIYKITKSDAYKDWVENHTDIVIDERAKEFLMKDDVLSNLMVCPLSGKVMTCPVGAPNDVVYDFFALKERFEADPQAAFAELGFNIDDVQFSYGSANRIINRLRAITTFGLPCLIVANIYKLSAVITQNKLSFYSLTCRRVSNEFLHGDITLEVYRAKLRDIRVIYKTGDAQSTNITLRRQPPKFLERMAIMDSILRQRGLAEKIEEFLEGNQSPEERMVTLGRQWQEAAKAAEPKLITFVNAYRKALSRIFLAFTTHA